VNNLNTQGDPMRHARSFLSSICVHLRHLWIVFLFVPPHILAQGERHDLLAKAESSTQAAAAKVKNDPSRPTFHILPPANWMNDPNGLLYRNGIYHLFYQYNPYGDEWGNMHWGHVRSKDLARWERQPIALWPSKSRGEDHVFSGSAVVRKDGTPMLFYTSIGKRNPEQWAAIPDDPELITWKKHPANPILTEALHGDTKIHEWRDPYLFDVNGKTHMVCGGNLNASKGGQGIVAVYRADNDDLTSWTYLGILFQHPDAAVKNIECPIFFPLEGKWVLIVSQGQPVDWFVGSLEESTMRFTPETRGKLDYGHVYAPNVLLNAPDTTPILWGWINGVPAGKGWRHCQTLPRALALDDARLLQSPHTSITLARPSVTNKTADLFLEQDTSQVAPEPISGAALEIQARFALGRARVLGLDVLRSSDGMRSIPIRYDATAKTLSLGDTTAPLVLPPRADILDLRVFVDHSIIEVYADAGRVCVTRAVDFHPNELGISAIAEGGNSRVALTAWDQPTIWTNP
jgi:beta-fructofuranosidase